MLSTSFQALTLCKLPFSSMRTLWIRHTWVQQYLPKVKILSVSHPMRWTPLLKTEVFLPSVWPWPVSKMKHLTFTSICQTLRLWHGMWIAHTLQSLLTKLDLAPLHQPICLLHSMGLTYKAFPEVSKNRNLMAILFQVQDTSQRFATVPSLVAQAALTSMFTLVRPSRAMIGFWTKMEHTVLLVWALLLPFGRALSTLTRD
jgi:hypothetical protein